MQTQGDFPGIPLKFEPGTDCESPYDTILFRINNSMDQSHMDTVPMSSALSSKKSRERIWSNICAFSSLIPRPFDSVKFVSRQGTIFSPLGLSSSFYRSPQIIEREVKLTYREPSGTLVPWNDQIKLIERDAQKGIYFFDRRE